MHAAQISKIIENSFGWRIEEIVRERQHQARHDRAADHRWKLVSSFFPSPTGAANLPSANQLQGTVWRNSSLSGRRRPSTTEPLRMLRDTSCHLFCARPALHGVCASSTSLLARGFRPRAALSAIGSTGHVTAADVSPAMAEKARERLGEARNASVLVEDAQALSFSDETFNAVVCNLGLMFFPEPAQALSEFRRVLRPNSPDQRHIDAVCTRFSRNRCSHFFAGRGVPARRVIP